MKKLLLLLVGAIVAFAAHADEWSGKYVSFQIGNDAGTGSTANEVQSQDYGKCEWKELEIGTNGFQIKYWDGSKNTWYGGVEVTQSASNWPKLNSYDSGNATNNAKIKNAKAGQKFNVTFYLNRSAIYVEPVGTPVTTTYELWSNFRNNGEFKGYTLDEANNYSYTLTFDGTETGTKAGLHVDGAWRGAANTSAYDGNTKTYNMTTTSGGDITFAEGLKGAVKFVLNVADNTLTVSGGTIEQVVTMTDFYLTGDFNDWKTAESEYKFTSTDGINYTLTLPEAVSGNIKITSGKWSSNGGIELTGTFVKLGEAFNVGAGSGNINAGNLPAGTVITLKYVKDGQSTLIIGKNGGDEPTPKYTTLYMHFKYDLEKGADGANTIPYCHVYDTTKQNASKGTWASEGEKMSKVEDYGVDLTKKYSIWKFELTEEDLEKYNAAVFYFRYGNEWMRYSTVTLHAGGSDAEYGNVTENDQNNWTKYIYATYSKDVNGQKEFAIQSYLTYDEFKARDMADIANGGRQEIYLLGWDGMQYFKENGNEPTGDAIGFPGDLIKDNLLTVENDHGCFFLPIKSTSDNARFKISWINPKAYAPASPDGSRMWATYDLGLCGVNKDFKSTSGWTPDYASNSTDAGKPNGKVWFTQNKSVPYMNYNQADWVMKSSTFPTNNTQKNYWLIVDTHTSLNSPWACQTATITSFNPQPSIKVTKSAIAKHGETLTDEVAEDLHVDHLYGSEPNGHVLMTNVNSANASADITVTPLDQVNTANFDRSYYVYMNEVMTGSVKEEPGKELKNVSIENMPLASMANEVSVRAEYEDKDTKLTFHSRTGKSEFTLSETLVAPNEITLEGQFVAERFNEETNKWVYGIYVKGLDIQYVKENLHGYSDFSFDCGSSAELIHGKSDIKKTYKEIETCSNWGLGEDWSSYLRLAASSNTAPVFIHDVVEAADVKDLDSKTVTCTLYAVYPVIYNPNATLTYGTGASLTPGNAIGSYEGFKVANARMATPVTFIVNPNNAVSSVEDIFDEIDADNAPVEYYTISGVRVMGQPAPGLYIRRQGDKVSKVVIR